MIINFNLLGNGGSGEGVTSVNGMTGDVIIDPFKVWKGTQEEYDAIEVKDKDVFYCISKEYDFKNKYFGVYAVEDGTVKIAKGNNAPNISLQYSVNNTDNWQTFNVNTNYNITKGDVMYFKGVNNTFASRNSAQYSNIFNFSNKVELLGNIMSLLFGDTYNTQNSLASKGAYTFNELFENQTNIISINNLRLNTLTLKTWCYSNLFRNCSGITEIPSNLLPATTLAQYCYNSMFYGCTSLKTLPEGLLPATHISACAYNYMFSGCSSLETVPVNLLPATSLESYVYMFMFENCKSLKNMPDLPAENVPEGAYEDMFDNCQNLTKSSIIKAKSLVNGPFDWTFWNCFKLKEVTLLCDTIKSDNTIGGDWLLNVAENGVINIPETATWDTTVARTASGVPASWTINKVAA